MSKTKSQLPGDVHAVPGPHFDSLGSRPSALDPLHSLPPFSGGLSPEFASLLPTVNSKGSNFNYTLPLRLSGTTTLAVSVPVLIKPPASNHRTMKGSHGTATASITNVRFPKSNQQPFTCVQSVPFPILYCNFA